MMTNQLLIGITFIGLMFISGKANSQEITLGTMQRIEYGFDGVYPIGNQSFFATHADHLSGAKIKLNHYTNFQEDASSGNLTSDERGVMVIDGKLFIFIQDKVKGESKLFAQEYGVDCKPVGTHKDLFSYLLDSKEDAKAQIIQSFDKQYFAVYYEITQRKQTKYAFKVFDKSFSMVREGSFDSPFDELSHRIREKVLSDQGDLYFTVNEAEISPLHEDKILGFHIWKLDGNQLNSIKIDINGKLPYEAKVISNTDGSVSCFGLVGGPDSEMKKAFIAQLDFNAHSCNISKEFELTKEFIGFEKDIYSYKVSDVINRKDGSTVFIVDQYVHTEGMKSTNSGTQSYSYITYYDIKVLMLDKNQDLVWTKRLGHENQVDYHGDYEKTYYTYATEDECIIYINLNKERDGFEAPVKFTVSADSKAAKNNCFGRIILDLNSGEMKRELLSSIIESDWTFDYRYAIWDEYSNGILLTFEQGFSKYRFGLSKF